MSVFHQIVLNILFIFKIKTIIIHIIMDRKLGLRQQVIFIIEQYQKQIFTLSSILTHPHGYSLPLYLSPVSWSVMVILEPTTAKGSLSLIQWCSLSSSDTGKLQIWISCFSSCSRIYNQYMFCQLQMKDAIKGDLLQSQAHI